MARKTNFSRFESYRLNGIKMTDQVLGHGSYASVLEMKYMGLKCAGKKIHKVLLEYGDTNYTIQKFEEECQLLSQIRHPNIVQFLGVELEQGIRVPILVMEFLPTNLTYCIEKYGILPEEISYSILHDVALGLCYLHSHVPPIIHRDLSSNNVLLTANMSAKISDLGVARMLNLTPQLVSRMTQTPGTPAFMPPEVMVATPRYDTSIDKFSYGVLMIHIFSGMWPEPQSGPTRIEGKTLIPVSEAERREKFLKVIQDCPLKDLIHRCISNDPIARPIASEIVTQLAKVVCQFPFSFTNRVEMLRHIATLENKTKSLRNEEEQKHALIRENEHEISHLKNKIQAKDKQKAAEIRQLKMIHSTEVEKLQLQIKDLSSQNQLLNLGNQAHLVELNSKIAIYEKNTKELVQERDKLTLQLMEEKEANRRLQSRIVTLELDKALKDASIKKNELQLHYSDKALQEKESIIAKMSEQLTEVREHMTTQEQVMQASITWKRCTPLPYFSGHGKVIVIDGKVYYGGGHNNNLEDECEYIVYCYDTSEDRWSSLPPLPVSKFGVGQVNGKLVTVGGVKNEVTNEIYTFVEQKQKWKQTIPPMPTPRNSPGVLSLPTSLVVAGGCTQLSYYTSAVEIFKPDVSQWYATDPLPTPCDCISLTSIGNMCYVLGGFSSAQLYLNQALYASVDDLLLNAVPANHTCSETRSISSWKTLPNTPNYGPTSGVLDGNLLAIGGSDAGLSSASIVVNKKVYLYSPSTNSWIYISDLPAPRYNTAIAVLSSTEILVIGGLNDYNNYAVNTMYKGALHLKN